MAWVSSDRKSRLPADWAKRRKFVLRRDGYRCCARLSDGTRCPEGATDVDHKRRGDDHSYENLQSLCGWHHSQKSSREGAAAQAKVWKRINEQRRLPGEEHPGAL